jgi:hypothetical protein
MKINNIFLTKTKYIPNSSKNFLHLDFNYFAEIVADNELYKFVVSAVNFNETITLIENYFDKNYISKRKVSFIKPVKKTMN